MSNQSTTIKSIVNLGLELQAKDKERKGSKEDYHVFVGFIPAELGEKETRTFKWDHPPELQKAGTDAFIWCNGVWGSIILGDGYSIQENTVFIRAPMCTTYIRKSKENSFLSSPDISFEMLGFKKRANSAGEAMKRNS